MEINIQSGSNQKKIVLRTSVIQTLYKRTNNVSFEKQTVAFSVAKPYTLILRTSVIQTLFAICTCKNNGQNTNFKFYRFPTAAHKLTQRNKWIAAIRKENVNGSTWIPKRSHYICSSHFIGNRKAEEESAPIYVPTIFPSTHGNKMREHMAIDRHDRFLRRRMKRMTSNIKPQSEENICNSSENIEMQAADNYTIDKACQANIFYKNEELDRTFVCNRYCFQNKSICDVEMQTNIEDYSNTIIRLHQKKLKDKQCNTDLKYFSDKKIGSDIQNEDIMNKYFGFNGYLSIKKEEQLRDLAGLSFESFNFLLKRFNDGSNNIKISKENRLLIFLIKIKTGLTFSAISVLFNIHKTTVSRIFFTALKHLNTTTKNLIFWPRKSVVMRSVPECFKHKDDRILCFSHYKKGFTFKGLIGITPSGFICFKSNAAGGRKSDSQLTVESGFIDLLEEDDTVLADKGFPEIKKIVDLNGKNVTVIMPPFLEKKKEFSQEETKQTYNVAKVRIHVE
ncbi:uncharacterized protein [Prorops nasuta]|uniref:uncharacterized protein n=1 Tax=Prorops nasuta TaxID=863751 RepID=UPI0034CE21F6